MEKKEQSFQEQLAESEQAFKDQFNPTSQTYHKGNTTVVPVGGERVPQSMSTMYPEGYDPNKPQEVVDYGESYREVETNRNVYQNLKKELAKLGPIVEAFMRHEDVFRLKGDPFNEQHKALHQSNIAKETQNLQAVQETLQTYVPILASMGGEGGECAQELSAIIFESGKTYDTKETLAEFNFKTKRLSTKTFAIAQKCLQQLKDIKKQHAANLKAAGEPKPQPKQEEVQPDPKKEEKGEPAA